MADRVAPYLVKSEVNGQIEGKTGLWAIQAGNNRVLFAKIGRNACFNGRNIIGWSCVGERKGGAPVPVLALVL